MIDVIASIESKIYELAGGKDQFQLKLFSQIRQDIASIIDYERTNRTTLEECTKTEKTYLGTKVEISIRQLLGVESRKLDLLIDDIDVDVKTTIGSNWMVPPEAFGHPCVLVKYNEQKNLLSVGLFVADLTNLSLSSNRDEKKTISKNGKDTIRWLIYNGVLFPKTKICKYCKQDKTLEEFPKNKNNTGGLDNRCRPCISARLSLVNQIKKTAPPKPKVCDCCNEPDDPENYINRGVKYFGLQCDHDPYTNKFRGWICINCNRAIGQLGDTIQGVQKAIEYLKRAKERNENTQKIQYEKLLV